MTSQQIQYGGRPPYWKSSFGYISTNDYPINAKFCRIKRSKITGLWKSFFMWYDQNTEFRKFKMADGRHFENSFIAISQPKIIRIQRNLVCRCRLCFQGPLLNKLPKFCKSKKGGRPPYWKSSFGYISTGDYPINAEFCRIKQNRVLTQVIWQKYQISKIQDGGWPPFWKWFYRYISSDLIEIWYADADCAFKVGYLTKC